MELLRLQLHTGNSDSQMQETIKLLRRDRVRVLLSTGMSVDSIRSSTLMQRNSHYSPQAIRKKVRYLLEHSVRFSLRLKLCMLFIFVALLNAVMVQMLSTTFFKVHRTPVSLAHISNGCGAYEDGLAEIVLMDIMGAISSLIWDLSISGECVISPIL